MARHSEYVSNSIFFFCRSSCFFSWAHTYVLYSTVAPILTRIFSVKNQFYFYPALRLRGLRTAGKCQWVIDLALFSPVVAFFVAAMLSFQLPYYQYGIEFGCFVSTQSLIDSFYYHPFPLLLFVCVILTVLFLSVKLMICP